MTWINDKIKAWCEKLKKKKKKKIKSRHELDKHIAAYEF